MRALTPKTNTMRQDGLAESLLRWWFARRAAKSATVRQMELLETLVLGGKRQLMLVRCSGEHFLVGGSSDQINTIVRVGAIASCVDQEGPCE